MPSYILILNLEKKKCTFRSRFSYLPNRDNGYNKNDESVPKRIIFSYRSHLN
jgi:hypothetical protein